MKRGSGLQWGMTVLVVAGMAVSAVALVTHYRSDKSAFCDLSESFNCDMVNRGPYATIPTSAPLTFPADPSQPPGPWLERLGDAASEHVVQPINDLLLRTGIRLPVAGVGVAGYIVLLALTWIGWKRRTLAFAQFALASLALLLSLYLTYVEKYIIAYWCILCLSSLAIIFLVTILSGLHAWRRPPARFAPAQASTSALTA